MKTKENLSGILAAISLVIFLFAGVVDMFGTHSGFKCLTLSVFSWMGLWSIVTILGSIIPILGMKIEMIEQIKNKISFFADDHRFDTIRLWATIASLFFYLYILSIGLELKMNEPPLTVMGSTAFLLIIINIIVSFRLRKANRKAALSKTEF